MSTEEIEHMFETIKQLPEQEQHEVLDFAEFLAQKKTVRRKKNKRQRTAGLLADKGVYMADDFDAPLSDGFWVGEADE